MGKLKWNNMSHRVTDQVHIALFLFAVWSSICAATTGVHVDKTACIACVKSGAGWQLDPEHSASECRCSVPDALCYTNDTMSAEETCAIWAEDKSRIHLLHNRRRR